MAGRSQQWKDSTLKRFLDEGRGQGEEDYKPWLKVSDIPSKGRVTRLYSRKLNRTIHLLTDSQTRYFYLLEFDDRVVSVKEQYPLLNIADIMDQLDESLVKRLKNRDGTPHVLVTTFLITAKDEKGQLRTYARSIKDRTELEKKDTLERLEIQRRYYESLKMEYAIVTSEEIPYQRSRNIEWVLPALYIEDAGLTEQEVKYYSTYIMEALRSKREPVRGILDAFERETKREKGLGLFLFRYLIASKQIEINLDQEINIIHTPEQMEVVVRKSTGVGRDVRSG
ncbi:TnsA endonuclease C-terminal domain-containing protein [Ferviditalea candida]|uniref:TnsA endonuclease C-terminal domain-containing protein n=1 Tax=Ferviditalea candida TaxID=3108399 RepID=A0ABU5ZND2_9BACL|nr:TnsA endonuclease C-terminal domain-containing protein [Paenibacillaceae bacterium T2]